MVSGRFVGCCPAGRLICIVSALLMGVVGGCASDEYMALYHTEALAPSLTWDGIAAMDHMGPVIIDEGVNFCVYSESAERIELALFDDPESTQPAQQFEMTRYDDALWSVYVEGVGVGQHYGYIAWGANWTWDESFYPYTVIGFKNDADSAGNRFNPNKLLTDPWAKAYHRGFDWSLGSAASGPSRDDSTYAAASKSVVVKEDAADREPYSYYDWSDEEQAWWENRSSEDFEGHNWNDLIIYEVHVKGFTANTAAKVDHPGTYMGFAEKADYLSELGITAVELLPIHQKEYSLGGYWGYATLNYFAPEVGYSETYQTTGEPYGVLDEFKYMVDTLHQHGIEVIIDVVFNHTGEGGLWQNKICPGNDYESCYEFTLSEVASIFSMRGLDNAAYYVVSDDGQDFHDATGVGHDVRANYTPVKRMIADSLNFYIDELHVDGFRFDLAAVLGQQDEDPDVWDVQNSVLQDLVDDPDLQARNIRLIAEPWSVTMGDKGGAYPASNNHDSYAFGEWNGGFRDFWAHFVNEDWPGYPLNNREYYSSVDIWQAMHGSENLFSGRKPYHSINYVTCHDGFTMIDLFRYDEAHNECGVLNPVCCYDPYSVWCDIEMNPWSTNARNWDDGDDDGNEPLKRQLQRNLLTAILLAQGTPQILGGDEWLRTQYGNDNAYSEGADNEFNWFRWGEWENPSRYYGHRMHDFVEKLIQFRKAHSQVFAPLEYGTTAEWLGTDGTAGSANWDGRDIMMYYGSPTEIAVIFNMNAAQDVNYSLPSAGQWRVVVDTQAYYDTPGDSNESGGYFTGATGDEQYVSANIDLDDGISMVSGSYTAVGQSIVVLLKE